jgi:hypothetical protein
VLQKARMQVFTPAQLASPLIRRPYDFRRAGVSWRLNAGTPAPLVAEWAGHTVEVLLRIYGLTWPDGPMAVPRMFRKLRSRAAYGGIWLHTCLRDGSAFGQLSGYVAW